MTTSALYAGCLSVAHCWKTASPVSVDGDGVREICDAWATDVRRARGYVLASDGGVQARPHQRQSYSGPPRTMWCGNPQRA
jgi:hypothetical protein